jgi:probable DNA metabolism protein
VSGNGHTGDWEQLWQTYHKAINNEDRANPKLQKQFMPKRYWKYLPELDSR